MKAGALELSVILPVYNVGPYLRECMDSIFKHISTPFELIAVNDGSTDDSLAILEEYKSNYYNMTIITQENKGLSVARNVTFDARVIEESISNGISDCLIYVESNLRIRILSIFWKNYCWTLLLFILIRLFFCIVSGIRRL